VFDVSGPSADTAVSLAVLIFNIELFPIPSGEAPNHISLSAEDPICVWRRFEAESHMPNMEKRSLIQLNAGTFFEPNGSPT